MAESSLFWRGEIVYSLLCCFIAKSLAAADDLFGEADDISSDSDAEKPPTPGQPLVSVCTLSFSVSFALIVPDSFCKSFPNLFFSEPLAKLL